MNLEDHDEFLPEEKALERLAALGLLPSFRGEDADYTLLDAITEVRSRTALRRYTDARGTTHFHLLLRDLQELKRAEETEDLKTQPDDNHRPTRKWAIRQLEDMLGRNLSDGSEVSALAHIALPMFTDDKGRVAMWLLCKYIIDHALAKRGGLN